MLFDSTSEIFSIGKKHFLGYGKMVFSKASLAIPKVSADADGDVYGRFYEQDSPESDPVTPTCQPIKTGPAWHVFYGDR